MLCAANIELLGLAGSGIFSTVALIVLNSPVTMMAWLLPVASGSAQISTFVFSAPMPARDSVAATFTLAGKPFAASIAFPSKILVLVLICAKSIPISST